MELISDRVAILDKGKLLKVGSIDEITSSGSDHRIGFEGTLPQGFKDEIAARVFKLTYDRDTILVNPGTTSDLNWIIDLLRRFDVPITFVMKEKSSLEDSFLNLIKKEVA